jgi:long-chain fatty acid transport protein
LAFVGDRFDFGVTWFRPNRSATITSPSPFAGNYDANGQKNFFIPELGYNHLLTPNISLGVSIFGNGGMNTTYTTPIPLLGTSRAGVNLEQLFVSPTLAVKVNSHNAFGIALNLGYQRFKANGLQNFASAASSDPTNVTDKGYANAFGAGVRIGWQGELTQKVSLGATFQTKTYMSKFGRYQGLFAEQGGFDIPANVAAGIAFKALPSVTLLLDGERIFYSDVKSIANNDSNQTQLGTTNGPGFGWHDITAIKTGAQYKLNSSLTLRGGYNHSGVPFDKTQTFFNILAPAVVQDHLTLGATWTFSNGREINLAYIHAFANTVYGFASVSPSFGGGNVNLRMYQDSVGISFGWDQNKK